MNENQNDYVDINAHDNYPDSEQKIKIPTMKVIPLKKICMTIGELPTSYLETMTYYEMLIWFIEFLKNNIIPTINNNASAIQEVQSVVLALQEYINDYKDSIDSDVEELEEYMNNYFENLDVQEEINNKLDDMLEDGVLEQIIEQFLQLTSLICFDNVADMKSSVNLTNGSYAKTLGYYSKNDGGGAYYKIRTITNDDTVNEMDIIEVYDDSLIGEYIKGDSLYIKQFGAYCDETHDDSDIWQFAINYASTNKIKLIGERNYSLISKTLLIPVPIKIENIYLKASNNISNFTNNYMIYINTTDGSSWISSYNDVTANEIKNIYLYNGTTTNILNGIKSIANIQLKDIHSYGLNKTIDSYSQNYIDALIIENILVSHKTGTDYAVDIGILGDMTSITNGHIYETIGTNYFINFRGAHRPSKISNIINGIISLNHGNISLNNYHGEGEGKSYIILKNGSFTLDTLSITDNKPCIRLDNARATISNFSSFYQYSKSYTTDNDILLENGSKIELFNSHKDVAVVGSAEQRLLSPIKTNVNDLNLIKNKEISNYSNISKNSETYFPTNEYLDNGISEILSGEWKLSSGTYYYSIMQCFDNERGIVQNFAGSRNITIGENAKAIQIQLGNNAKNKPIRVLRGTSNGSYTHYIDLFIEDPVIRDNGNIVNGNLWKAFDNAQSGFFSSIVGGFTDITFSGNNIIGHKSAVPNAGTFKKGDIIYNTDGTGNNPIGWICVADGTPGTWKTL